MKSFLSKKFRRITLWTIIALAPVVGSLFSLMLLLLFFLILFLFRVKKHNISETNDLIFSPVTGTVSHIEHADEVKLQLVIPLGGYMGVSSPILGEVEKVVEPMECSSFFRYSNNLSEKKKLNHKVSLSLKNNKNMNIGLDLFKCWLSFSPQVSVEPGDKTKSGGTLGYLPLGGSVVIKLPQNIDIMVQKGDNMIIGESILARFN